MVNDQNKKQEKTTNSKLDKSTNYSITTKEFDKLIMNRIFISEDANKLKKIYLELSKDSEFKIMDSTKAKKFGKSII